MEHFHFSTFFQGAFAYGIIAYALKTIPVVDNPWAKWLIGILQFGFSNSELAKQQLVGVTDLPALKPDSNSPIPPTPNPNLEKEKGE